MRKQLILLVLLSLCLGFVFPAWSQQESLKMHFVLRKAQMQKFIEQHADEYKKYSSMERHTARLEYLELGRVFASARQIEMIQNRYEQRMLDLENHYRNVHIVESYMKHSIHCSDEMLRLLDERYGKVYIDSNCLE